MKATPVIAVANQKGGVGKTNTAVTLAAGLARMGYHVLIIDTDPQGNVSDCLGLVQSNCLGAMLMGFDCCPVQARSNLDVIRSSKDLVRAKAAITADLDPARAIANALDQHKLAPLYDYIILDCAPSIDVLHVAALVASTHVIIPTRPDQFAIVGCGELIKTVASLNKVGLSTARVIGILPTFYDWQTNESRLQLANLAQALPGLIWPVIPQDARVRLANREGQTLWEVRPTTRSIELKDGGRVIGGYNLALGKLLEAL